MSFKKTGGVFLVHVIIFTDLIYKWNIFLEIYFKPYCAYPAMQVQTDPLHNDGRFYYESGS